MLYIWLLHERVQFSTSKALFTSSERPPVGPSQLIRLTSPSRITSLMVQKRRLAVREFGLTVALKITGVTMSLRKRFGLRHRISATASAIGLQRRRRFPR